MKAQHLELLVEEPSMETFLNEILPSLLPPDCTFNVHSSRNRQRLLNNLEKRLGVYARSIEQDYRIIVLVDRDSDDCYELKQRLEAATASAGLRSRSTSGTDDWQVANRIVIEELEAWYFGDWQAVQAAYPNVRNALPRRYRNPDAIPNGTWEAFERVMQRSGYFEGGLRKTEAAQSIGRHSDPARSNSRSFIAFREAVIEATAG